MVQRVPTKQGLPGPLLAVDDEPAIRRLVQLSLSYSGYTVETADDVPTAQEMIKAKSYAMIISDLNMPGGTGLDLLEFVQRVSPETPFVLLTGTSDTATARKAIAAGAADFITKPFRPQDLVRVVEQNWERAIVNRALAAELTNDVLTDTIRALVAAVDAKDPYTASHSERVAALSLMLGGELRLDESTLKVLEFAALLHDVGKIAVPTSILRKPGALSAEEWDIIKKHPEISADIVSKVSALSDVAKIVRHHHEWLNGAGYPDGLTGDDIPYLARVITIADAFEAMTSARAYRPAMDYSTAKGIIRENSGSQFDAAMAQSFLGLVDLKDFLNPVQQAA